MLLYCGPSEIDGKWIVAIATPKSSNDKTGDMVQTWILPAEESPVDAVKSGLDESVCGDCPHRHYNGGACYVLPFQAPRGVYEAWKRGSYNSPKHIKRVLKALSNKKVRLGAYGDPAAVPQEVWSKLVEKAKGHTGYTHQWHKEANLQSTCMASVDSIKEAEQAKALGYRYFLVLKEDEEAPADSIECPADSRGITCAQCGLCNGKKGDADTRKNIWIRVHGAKKGRFSPKLRVVQ